MALVLKTAPAAEPILPAEAKLHLRVDHDDEDTYISALIKTARHDAETITRRALITQTWELVMDDWPENDWFEIPLPPLQSVTSITYTDSDGAMHTLSAADYVVDTDSEPGRVRLVDGASWPTVELRPLSAIRVTFVAGYGDAGAAVPEPIRQAMYLLIGHYYENREAVINSTGANVQLLPLGVTTLLQTYRMFCF